MRDLSVIWSTEHPQYTTGVPILVYHRLTLLLSKLNSVLGWQLDVPKWLYQLMLVGLPNSWRDIMVDVKILAAAAKTFSVEDLRAMRRVLAAELAARAGRTSARREKVRTRRRA